MSDDTGSSERHALFEHRESEKPYKISVKKQDVEIRQYQYNELNERGRRNWTR